MAVCRSESLIHCEVICLFIILFLYVGTICGHDDIVTLSLIIEKKNIKNTQHAKCIEIKMTTVIIPPPLTSTREEPQREKLTILINRLLPVIQSSQTDTDQKEQKKTAMEDI